MFLIKLLFRRFLFIYLLSQIQLRRHALRRRYDRETDLYQWFHGSKFCCGPLEAIIALHGREEVEVKVRGPGEAGRACFFFLEEILGIIDQVECSASFRRFLSFVNFVDFCQSSKTLLPIGVFFCSRSCWR